MILFTLALWGLFLQANGREAKREELRHRRCGGGDESHGHRLPPVLAVHRKTVARGVLDGGGIARLFLHSRRSFSAGRNFGRTSLCGVWPCTRVGAPENAHQSRLFHVGPNIRLRVYSFRGSGNVHGAPLERRSQRETGLGIHLRDSRRRGRNRVSWGKPRPRLTLGAGRVGCGLRRRDDLESADAQAVSCGSVIALYALLYADWRSTDLDARARRVLRNVMFISFALSVPTMHDVIGKNLAVRLEMGSVVTYGSLIMLGGLLWYRSLAPREAA